ncbi:hypothetical protein GYMLUDRAFT_57631 [Collybiopsis luxurians FD-317 M1]|uniref:Uncharacterized protein n=1 Tax=Collybiopsis luxurians FD-317 M1 TaxID=944289 RepID=A0A0D0D2I7_9AGAR|nr:hypothetical protein GYMLUDRAFT_57631 [Collybiopsis luxurians FD-317 M1]
MLVFKPPTTPLPLPEAAMKTLLNYISHATTAHFRIINKQTAATVEGYEQRAYSFVDYIAPFFNHTKYHQLRDMQRKTKSLLSGEPIDRFFNRMTCTGQLLLITFSTHVGTFLHWFTTIDYELQNESKLSSDEVDGNGGFIDRGSVTHHSQFVRRNTTVHLIGCQNTTIEVILNFPHSASFDIDTSWKLTDQPISIIDEFLDLQQRLFSLSNNWHRSGP